MSEPCDRGQRGESGFTLIEMVLTLILVGIIAAITGIMMQQGVRAYLAQDIEANIADQGRLGIERMAREVRTIRSRTAADIPVMAPGALSFVDVGGTLIAYASGGGNVTRDGTVLASAGTATLTFSYFQQNGAATLDPTQVWVIQVDLVMTTGGETQAFRIRVHPRSFT